MTPIQSNTQPGSPIPSSGALQATTPPQGQIAAEQASVAPHDGLGANFERPALRPLALRARSAVWGDTRSQPGAGDVEPRWDDQGAQRTEVLHDGDFRCIFCDFRATSNEINCLNGNHSDKRRENLAVTCPVCNRWQHLEDLNAGAAHIAYMPDLSPRDANHLYRTIVVALGCDDEAMRRDAKALLNWMASHNQYVEDAWGTSSAAAFGTALQRLEADDEVKRALALDGLTVVFAPGQFERWAKQWRQETTREFPIASWPAVHHDAMNPPK